MLWICFKFSQNTKYCFKKTLKFGKIVFVIEVTADLYKVKADKKSSPTIISKKDLRIQ